jgi:hypothetical protein
MARCVDVVKLRLWQQRLLRFERGNLTIAVFYQAERVRHTWQRYRKRFLPEASSARPKENRRRSPWRNALRPAQ